MARRRTRFSALAAAFLLPLCLGSCNLFNPSGETDLSGNSDDLVTVGEVRMREKDFQGAYDAFQKAIEKDPANSLAWHGLAKASVARDSLPITDLIRRAQDLGNLKPSDKMPFLTESDSVKNRFYRPLLRLQRILASFRLRDSLGQTDGVFAFSREQNDYIIAANLGLVMKLGDLNRDTVYDSRDNLLKGAFDSLGSGGLQPSAISADSFLTTGSDGTPDTTGAVSAQKVADFNTFLGGMNDDIETNRAILQKAAAGSTSTSTDTSSSKEDVNAQIDKFLESAGQAIVFWKINDSLDNDGDGCTDEEVWGDKIDNDGDGIVDEDARASYLIPGLTKSAGTTFARSPDDGIRNDRVRIAGDSTKWVAGTDDADSGVFVWSDASGHVKSMASLTWVDPKTDSVYARIVKENPTKTEKENVEKARNQIRLQILKLPPAQRIVQGAARVGGCWAKMVGGFAR